MLTTTSFHVENNTLTLHLGPISLRGGLPVVNGQVLAEHQLTVVMQKEDTLAVRFNAPSLGETSLGVSFSFNAGLIEGTIGQLVQIRYWMAGLPAEFVLDSFGLHFTAIENLRSYLKNGYHSWDGSSYHEPEAMGDLPGERPETGYAMAQFLPRFGAGSAVLGFDRHDRFQHTFEFDTHQRPTALTIQTLWDRKDRQGTTRLESERLVAFAHAEVENALRAWAELLNKTTRPLPRVFAKGITGWCSWYNLYAYISEENILEHLHAAQETALRDNLPMRVFQMDDGFTPEMGDWLDLKPQFPRGMKPLLDDIRAAGFIPGLWIAPFLVGCRSKLYRQHPDWVVKDVQTGGPLTCMKFYGEMRWHKRTEEYYVLDTTHPEAFEYLRQVFHTWRHEWGCDYFKTDFMLFGSDYGPDRAIFHTPGMTRIENFNRVVKMIRQEIGNDALWLGCGCPLWATIGLVDGVRIGGDVGVDWSGGLSAQSLLRDQSTRNFGNHILWQIDPDCVLLRQHFHNLSNAEVDALAIYAGMSGGVMMTSDHLGELGEERLRLWKLLLEPTRKRCNYPLLGQTPLSYISQINPWTGKPTMDSVANDPVFVQVRPPLPAIASVRSEGVGAIFVLNSGDLRVQRTYPLETLGIKGPLYVYDWMANTSWHHPVSEITVTLERHEGRLWFVGREPITQAPERLP
jgi:hypothetical protein